MREIIKNWWIELKINIFAFIVFCIIFVIELYETNKYVKVIKNYIARTEKTVGITVAVAFISSLVYLKNVYNIDTQIIIKIAMFIVTIITSIIVNNIFEPFYCKIKKGLSDKINVARIECYNNSFLCINQRKLNIVNGIDMNLEYICWTICSVMCLLILISINYLIVTVFFRFNIAIITYFLIAIHKSVITYMFVTYISHFAIDLFIYIHNAVERFSYKFVM